MIGDLAVDRRHRGQPAGFDEMAQQLGVVDDLVVAAELRVLVRQRVEAVRAGSDDLARAFGAVLEDAVEDLDVLLGETLEHQFVAQATSRVAGAGLAGAHDAERDAGQVEQLGDRAGDLLGTVFERAGAAHPEQVLDVLGDLALDLADLEVQAGHPVLAGRCGHAPGVALALEVLQHHAGLGRERRLDQHLVATHVEDVVDVLDVDRALLDAGAAGGAGPEHVRVDDTVLLGGADQRTLVRGEGQHVQPLEGVRVADLLAHAVGAATGLQVRRLRVHVIAKTHDEQLRRQRLAGVPGGALRLATPALGAGGEVEQALPGEVLDLRDAEQVLLRVCLFEVDLLAVAHHRFCLTEGVAAVGVALEEDVEECPQPVPTDTHGGLARQDEEERPRGHDLDECDQADQQAGGRPVHADRLPQVRDRVRDRGRPQPQRLVADRVGAHDPEGADQQDGQADGEDDGLDEVGLPEGRSGEPGLALRIARVRALAHDRQCDDADHGADREDLGDDRQQPPLTDDRQVPVRVERLAVGLEKREEQPEEAEERQPVGEADVAPLEHLGMPERLAEHGFRPGTFVEATGAVRLAALEGLPYAERFARVERNRRDREKNGDDEKNPV